MTGDVGDYWNEAREDRRAIRRHWHECPDCAVSFGTGTLVAPGEKCRHDGWQAPGQKGDDRRAARQDHKDEEWQEFNSEWRKLRAQDKTRRRNVLRTCRKCGKKLKSTQARKAHEKDKHPGAEMPSFEELM